MDTPLTVPHAPLGCSSLKCLKADKFAELLRVAVLCITWLSKIYRKRTYHPWRQRHTFLSAIGSQVESNGQVCCTATVKGTGKWLRVLPLNQPQYQETVLESFQQLRVQPTYF